MEPRRIQLHLRIPEDIVRPIPALHLNLVHLPSDHAPSLVS